MTTDNKEGGAQWEMETAWKQAVAARKAGDTEGEALGMRRYADGLVNASYSGIASLITPLNMRLTKFDEDLNKLADVLQYIRTVVGPMGSRLDTIEAAGEETRLGVNQALAAIEGVAASVGGLEARVERVEVGLAKVEIRVGAVEREGAPATAVDALGRLEVRVERVETLLLLTRRQLWLTFASVAGIALIFIAAILLGGGR